MKIFSALLAFVIMFAGLSVAYADVALPPRPRNVKSDFITVDVDNDKNLSIKFEFPYECKYEYRLVDVWEDSKQVIHRDEILSGKGKYKSGNIVEDTVNLKDNLLIGSNIFVLTIEMSDIKEQTRFGVKTRRGTEKVTKTILIQHGTWNRTYGLRVYDGERD